MAFFLLKSKEKEELKQKITQMYSEIESKSLDIEQQNQIITKNDKIIDMLKNECKFQQNASYDNYKKELQQEKILLSLKKQIDCTAKEKDALLDQIEEINVKKSELEVEIQKLKQIIATQNEITSVYHPVSWATGLIPYWREYYYENYNLIKNKLHNLKESMDEESCKMIDLICERNFHLLPPAEDSDKFLYNYDKLYTDFEKEGLKKPVDKENLRKKFNISKKHYIETSVAGFHNGLLLLPNSVTAKIKGKDIIDGGAYWGDSALVFQDYGPRSVHCFEPNSNNYKDLLEIIHDNDLDNIIIPNDMGLADVETTGSLISFGLPSCGSLLGRNVIPGGQDKKTQESIKLTAIDLYANANNLEVGLIKLDIEGYEYNCILGALETIKKSKPLLLISIYHTPKDFFEIKPLLEELNLGYKFMIRKTTYRDLIAEVMLIAYIDKI